MQTNTNISTRTAALAAMAAGVVIGVGGILQLTDAQSGESTTVGIEHLGLATFTGLLLLLVPVVLYLGRLAGRPRIATVAVIGQVALALLTVISNIRGEDPSFFPAVAAPANLAIFAGLVTIAVSLKRRGALPKAMAVGLGVVWIVTLPLSNLGGMVLAGGYWLALGWLLQHGDYPHAGTMTRKAIVAAAVAAACMAVPAAAQADSLVFIKEHDVWLSEPDGSGLYQVTTDGTADNPYVSPSQSDDGTIVAGRDKPNGGPLYRMKQNGKVLNTIPVVQAVAGPFRPHVSPDGQTVAYEEVFSRDVNGYLETSSDVRFTRADGSTPGGLPGEVGSGSGSPSWIDSSRAMVGLNNVVHTVSPGSAPAEWWFDYDHYDWFGYGTNIEDGEYAGGNVAVVRGVEDSPENTIQMYRHEGDFAANPAPTCTISGPVAGANGQFFADPTFAPDGRALAFQQGDGIHVMSYPSGNCLDGQPRLVIAGGSQPDWSPAPVNPGQRETADCGSCGTPPRAGLALKLPKRVSASKLRKGLVVRVTTPGAGSLSATAAVRRKRVGSGRGKATASGTARVRVRFKKKALRPLRRAKRLSLKVAFRPAGGGAAQTAKASVRLGR
jgi:hypothetical protein